MLSQRNINLYFIFGFTVISNLPTFQLMSNSANTDINNEQGRSNRDDGYYWVRHDDMWFAAYYLSSEDIFYFPGQTIGFDPSELEEIDEQKIERQSCM